MNVIRFIPNSRYDEFSLLDQESFTEYDYGGSSIPTGVSPFDVLFVF